MHNVILISSDATMRTRCTNQKASQLLHQGLARITKLYPYTLQLKGNKSSGLDSSSSVINSLNPSNMPPLSAKKRLKSLEEVV